MARKKKYLLSESAGPSQGDWGVNETDEFEYKPLYDDEEGGDGEFICYEVTCKICGTTHHFHEGEYRWPLLKFLGRQVVTGCCGKVLDIVYEESGKQMTINFLEDFAVDPTNKRFQGLAEIILQCLNKAQANLVRTTQEVDLAQAEAVAYNKVIESL